MTRRALTLLALVLALVAGCEARIRDEPVERDGRALIPIAMDYGFEEDGSIEISIQHPVHLFTVENAPEIDKTKLGFFITASKADTALEADIAKGGCLLDDLDHTLVLFTFADMAEHLNEEGDEYKFSYTIAPGKQGEYSLYYTNCVPNTAVSFNLEVELYNPMPAVGRITSPRARNPCPRCI
jgi:hypothetical protein